MECNTGLLQDYPSCTSPWSSQDQVYFTSEGFLAFFLNRKRNSGKFSEYLMKKKSSFIRLQNVIFSDRFVAKMLKCFLLYMYTLHILSSYYLKITYDDSVSSFSPFVYTVNFSFSPTVRIAVILWFSFSFSSASFHPFSLVFFVINNCNLSLQCAISENAVILLI